MATPQEILAALAARRIPESSLISQGGRSPVQPQVAQAQAPRPRPVPQGLSGQIMAALAAQNAARNPLPAPEGPGGLKGLLSKIATPVLGNRVAHAALKPLEALKYTAAPMTAVAKEAVDVALPALNETLAKLPGVHAQDYDTDKIGDGSFDFGDIWKNTKEAKGFGSLIVEPIMGEKGTDRGIWTRRLFGLAGDVAADPLTYLSGGATQAAGKVGRRELAAKAVMAGFNEEQVARAARGAAFLKPAEREALGIERAGLYFGGKNGVRIAGTEGLSNSIFRRTGAVREAAWNSRLGRVISNEPERIEEAAQVLAGMKGSQLSKTQAAAIVAYHDVAKMATNGFVEPAQHEAAQRIFSKVTDETASALTHAVEAGADNELTPFMRELRKAGEEAGVSFGDLGPRYMPHLRSEEFQKLIDGNTRLGNELKKLTVDDSKATGVVLERKIRGGVHEIMGKKVDLGSGTIREWNAALTKAFPDAGITTWLKDDARDLVSYYINSLGKSIGTVKGFKSLLDRGLASNVDDVADDVLREYVDTTANQAAKKAGKELLKKRELDFRNAQAEAVVKAGELQTELAKKLHGMLSDANAVDAQFKDIVKGLTEGRQALVDVKGAIYQRAKALKDDAQSKLDELERQWYDLEAKIDAEKIALSATRATEQSSANLQRLMMERAQLQEKVAAARAAERRGDQLAEDLAHAVAASEELAANADDPDFVERFAQSLVPTKDVEVRTQTGLEQVDPQGALAQARTAAARTENLRTTVADDTMRELQTVHGVEQKTAQYLDQAKTVEQEARSDLESATNRMVAARRARGASASDIGARPTNVKSLRATKGTRIKWLPAERELAEQAGIMDDLAKFRDAAERRYEQEASTLNQAARARDTIQEGVDLADQQAATFNERAAEIQARPLAHRAGTPVEQVRSAQRQIDKAVDQALTKAVNHMRTAWLGRQELERAQAELARALSAAKSESDIAKLADDVFRDRLQGYADKVAAAEAEASQILATLPKEEREYYQALQDMIQARELRQRVEKQMERAQAAVRRVERRGTPEAEIAARESLQPMLDASAAASSYYKPRFAYHTETRPTMELAPKAELEAGLADAVASQSERLAALDKEINTLNTNVKRARARMAKGGGVRQTKAARKRFEDVLADIADEVIAGQDEYKLANKHLKAVTGGADSGIDEALRARPGATLEDVEEVAGNLGTEAAPAAAQRNIAVDVQSKIKQTRNESVISLTSIYKALTGEEISARRAGEIVDTLRAAKPRLGKGFSAEQKVVASAAARKRADDLLDELWEKVPVAKRMQLLEDDRAGLAASERRLKQLRAERVSVRNGGPQAQIEKQLGIHGEAERQTAEAAAAAKQRVSDIQGQIESDANAFVEGGLAAEQLPNVGRSDATTRISSDIAQNVSNQTHIGEATDALDAAMRRIDETVADDYARIDQAVAARDNAIAVMKDRSNVATEEAKRIEGQLKKVEKLNVGGRAQAVSRELESIVKQLPDDPDLAPVFALHAAYSDALVKATMLNHDVVDIKGFIAEAKSGKLNTIFKTEAMKGWTEVVPGLFADGQRIAIPDEMAQGMKRLIEGIDNGDAWKAIDAMTQFFKTYATATPGFHLRNAMSAVFMNMTEGVTLAEQREAIAAWREFRKSKTPMKYIDDLAERDPQLAEAFKATFGSGAGGGYSSEELGHWSSPIMHNAWTRWNRKMGADVEGSVRLALGINTTRNGGSAADALTRISRIHFDYAEVGRLDRKIKHFIPFWTFMSRNLPLQMQQIWMRPKMYAIYGHAANALSQGNEFEGMPQWLADKSAIPLGPHGLGGNQDVISPDLPFLNASQDLETLDIRNPLRALSNMNPVMVAPLEAISNKDFYYDSDLRENPLAHILRSVASPVAQAERLSDRGKYEGKQGEKFANFFGIPYRTVTQEQIAREMQRRASSG